MTSNIWWRRVVSEWSNEEWGGVDGRGRRRKVEVWMEGEGGEGWWEKDGGDGNRVAVVWSGGRVRRRWVGEWRRRELEGNH